MNEGLKQRVLNRYAEAVRSVLGEAEQSGSCCGGGVPCCGVGESGERAALKVNKACGSYSEIERSEFPQRATEASLGCGNPVALATLSPGKVVLDLGSGGGIDVLLSARRVAPGGRSHGLDMTDEMLELARRNQTEAGFEEVAVEVAHTYPPKQIAGVSGQDAEALRKIPAASAFILAHKPVAR